MNKATAVEFVNVRDVGNPVDGTTGSGNVDYEFEIGKYPITNAQYADFLNAVAAHSDPFELYSANMKTGLFGGIERIEQNDTFFYSEMNHYGSLPVVYASWLNAARFCNWLHFGQPRGSSLSEMTEGTPDIGAYDTSNVVPGFDCQIPTKHNTGAKYWIPTLDEWNKAAYFDPTIGSQGGYWLYPTRSDTKPNAVAPPGDANSANYFDFHWAAPDPYLTPVGSYYSARSYYGTFDQGGNVWEWVETTRGRNHKWVRGGAATTFSHALARTNTDSELPDQRLYIFGFRVARAQLQENRELL